MSITTEISRIQADRNTIRAKLVELGMATSADNLTKLASAIEALVNRGAVSVEIKEGTSYTIPAGYHNGSGTVKAVSDAAGDAETYKTQAKTVTPTKKQQSVTPDVGYYALESVTVAPIPDAYQDVSSVDAVAAEVLTGKIFVAANGTVIAGEMPNNGAVSQTLSGTTINYTIPKGYHNGLGKVQIVLETKTVTPTKAAQDITPSNGKVLSKVTVNPIPAAYQDVSSVTATADKVLKGSKFVDAEGNEVEGTMPNRGSIDETLDIQNTIYSIDYGYSNGGRVKIIPKTKEAWPTESRQTITPDEGTVLSEVVVYPISAEYANVYDATAERHHLLAGEVAYSQNFPDPDTTDELMARRLVGTMPNNGDTSKTFDGMTTNSVTIPEGYTTGGTVSLTNDIENALKAI